MDIDHYFSKHQLIPIFYLFLNLSAGNDWATYLGHPSSNQFSKLDQINKENVTQLELAWTYQTGDSANYQTNNLIVDGLLYTATPHSRVVALDGP